MKEKFLAIFLLCITQFCFAQIKTFEITDVNDYEDIEDNIILANKTSSKIFEASVYGVKERDCPDGFLLSDFVQENDDGVYKISQKAEKIVTFRGIKAGKSAKLPIDRKTFKHYQYFIVYVSEPEEFKFSISEMKERHSDLYLCLEGTGREKEVVVQKEYVYVDNSSSSTSSYSEPTYPTTSSSSPSSSSSLTDTLQSVSNQLNDWSNGKCSTCNGTGKCSYCKGTGKSYGNNCWSCKGTGNCSACGGDGDWIH